ncbi:MAG: VWA domain-containing protein [Planctomycetaceae bacterium]
MSRYVNSSRRRRRLPPNRARKKRQPVHREPRGTTESERKSDIVAVVTSTFWHVVLLVVGALIYVGNAGEPEATIITQWADETDAVLSTIETVELIEKPTLGGNGQIDPATSAVVAQTSVSGASADVGLKANEGGGLGGAFFGSGESGRGSGGKRIVYIVDASGSMTYRLLRMSRFSRVQRELETSILSLHESQKFGVILFNDYERTLSTRALRAATERNKNRVISRVWKSGAGGGTDPRAAIRLAMRMRPDTIYFLTDGEFLPASAAQLLQKQKGLTVHTFTLGDSRGEAIMQRIANVNGGTYRFIDGRPPANNQSTAASGSTNSTP